MNKSAHFVRLLVFLALSIPNSFANGGGGSATGGNGGDLARELFFSMGYQVKEQLKHDPTLGGNLPRAILPEDFDRILTLSVVRTTDETLLDNSNPPSPVAAIGAPGSITLSSRAWIKYSLLSLPTNRLVFHEILRALGINDDEFRYSKHLPLLPNESTHSFRNTLHSYLKFGRTLTQTEKSHFQSRAGEILTCEYRTGVKTFDQTLKINHVFNSKGEAIYLSWSPEGLPKLDYQKYADLGDAAFPSKIQTSAATITGSEILLFNLSTLPIPELGNHSQGVFLVCQ